MSKRLVFDVTQEDISLSGGCSWECPITRGILRKLGLMLDENGQQREASGVFAVRSFSDYIYLSGRQYRTSEGIRKFIKSYDSMGRGSVKPGRFALVLR